jgi:hypothetical protein
MDIAVDGDCRPVRCKRDRRGRRQALDESDTTTVRGITTKQNRRRSMGNRPAEPSRNPAWRAPSVEAAEPLLRLSMSASGRLAMGLCAADRRSNRRNKQRIGHGSEVVGGKDRLQSQLPSSVVLDASDKTDGG